MYVSSASQQPLCLHKKVIGYNFKILCVLVALFLLEMWRKIYSTLKPINLHVSQHVRRTGPTGFVANRTAVSSPELVEIKCSAEVTEFVPAALAVFQTLVGGPIQPALALSI